MSRGRAIEVGPEGPGQTLKGAPSAERPRQHGAPVNTAARADKAARTSAHNLTTMTAGKGHLRHRDNCRGRTAGRRRGVLGKEVRGADPGHTRTSAASRGPWQMLCLTDVARLRQPSGLPGADPARGPSSARSLPPSRGAGTRRAALRTRRCAPGTGGRALCSPLARDGPPLPLYNPLRPSHLLMTSQAISDCL